MGSALLLHNLDFLLVSLLSSLYLVSHSLSLTLAVVCTLLSCVMLMLQWCLPLCTDQGEGAGTGAAVIAAAHMYFCFFYGGQWEMLGTMQCNLPF